MQYPSKQTYVDAVRYEAPVDDTSDGNLAELQAFVGEATADRFELRKQDPWNPAAGQNCLLLAFGGPPVAFDPESGEPTEYAEELTQVLSPGDYLARLQSGKLPVAVPGASFEAAYDVPAPPVERLKTAPADGIVKTGIEVPPGETGTVSNEPSATE